MMQPLEFSNEKFRLLRLRKRFTLRDVEKITGISNAYLSQLETGKIKKPSYEVVQKLISFYTELASKSHCPCCFSDSIKDEKISQNNGVFGPGFNQWHLIEFSVCQDCGVMFKKNNTI